MRIALAALLFASPPALAQRGHVPECSQFEGIRKVRCERHEKMYDQCHAISGPAHHECDRQFLIAHPLDCTALSGGDAGTCQAEVEAVAACKDREGREFFACARERLRADPRH
ncbi:MAG TPA: hypothetical protein VFV88_12530 [Steroidobacteraceae bacterium]|nr:hypothetical protein [Steroidobacteraceae bacterium]